MRGVSMARGTKPNWMIDIAQERMDILFNRAEKEYGEHPERSHRYVELARKISKKYNTKIPQAWGRRYCKNCYKFLVPGKGELKLTLTLSKKEIMNEARSAMTINIGKAGVNDNVIEEIKRQLKSNPIIKLRFAKNVARNKDDLISNIVEGTKSQLIDVRGNVAVIYKKQSN